MAKKLDLKRLKLQLVQVSVARQAMELQIDERMEEIDRVKANIDVQLKREKELENEIIKMESEPLE